MTGIPVIPGVLLSSRAFFVIPSGAEGSVNSFYRFLHSLCSVEMAIPVCLPPVTCGDSPVGACGSASLRRHLHCFGSLAGNLADAPVRP